MQREIEHIPLRDASVDVIISNCVINLSADKRLVLSEAFRVLGPDADEVTRQVAGRIMGACLRARRPA